MPISTKETLDFSVFIISEELDINIEPPSKEELDDKAINLLKQNKAPDVDRITSELFQDSGEAVKDGFLVCAS